jgi:hypothetical protein
MKWSLVVVALVLCGCGTVGQRNAVRAAPLAELEPAPPIVAVDEPAPDGVLWFLDSNFDSNSPSLNEICVQDGADSAGHGSTDECPPMTPEQEAQAREQQKEWDDAVRPAPGTAPRTVARLTLSNDATVRFVVWHNAAGELCTDIEEDSPDGSGGGGGPGGPCIPGHPCGEVCVDSTGSGDLGDLTYYLTGFVPSEADSVRITLKGGTAKMYPLNGPVVDGTDRRVLMVELGRQDWRRIEAFRGDRLVAAQDLPAYLVAYDDCDEQVGPMPTPTSENDPALEAYNQKLEACLSARLPSGP